MPSFPKPKLNPFEQAFIDHLKQRDAEIKKIFWPQSAGDTEILPSQDNTSEIFTTATPQLSLTNMQPKPQQSWLAPTFSIYDFVNKKYPPFSTYHHPLPRNEAERDFIVDILQSHKILPDDLRFIVGIDYFWIEKFYFSFVSALAQHSRLADFIDICNYIYSKYNFRLNILTNSEMEQARLEQLEMLACFAMLADEARDFVAEFISALKLAKKYDARSDMPDPSNAFEFIANHFRGWDRNLDLEMEIDKARERVLAKRKALENLMSKVTEAKEFRTFKPGMSIITYAKTILESETNADRRKWLQTFLNCKLPPSAAEGISEALTMVLASHKFEEWGVNEHFEKGITNAILLWGPPGTGKSMVCESLAAVLQKDLMKLSTAELQSQVPGAVERNIKKAFAEAKEKKCVLMFDECDSVLYNRDMVGSILAAETNCLLTELENHDGVVVFTTNRIHKLDPALDRRIICKIHLDVPTQEARLEIWQALIPTKTPRGEINYENLSLHVMTGGEIKNAILLGIRRAISTGAEALTQEHLSYGVTHVLASKSDFNKKRKTHFGDNEAMMDMAGMTKKTGGGANGYAKF